MRRRQKFGRRLLGAAIVLVLLAGCSATTDGAARPPTAVLPASEVSPLVDRIAKQPAAKLPAMRLAPGLAPPTNKWFSGLVFGDRPQPVFPLPLSFALTEGGFTFGVPQVHTGPDTIEAPLSPAISVNANAARSTVIAYDESSVTIDERDRNGRSIGTVLIAEGSPLVTFTAKRSTTLELSGTYTVTRPGTKKTLVTSRVDGNDYGLSTTGHLRGSALSLSSGQTAVWVAVPRGASLGSLSSRLSPLLGTSFAYSTGANSVTTTIGYRTADGSATLVAAMPHQRSTATAPANCTDGSYPSVYGTLALCIGSSLSWSSAKIDPSSSLDVASLTAAQKSELRAQVASDTDAGGVLPTDTYFGGKALYRLANLLQLAEQLGMTDASTRLQSRLDDALISWTEPKGCSTRSSQCFVYDEQAKGIIGLTASFGSDQFNDHHFHYGYFLYAASVAVRYDASLTSRLGPVLTLLAADLASGSHNGDFPQLRLFDAYAGHSWASGFAPFASGNNQESSSEAVAAWNGLALWAQASKNGPLEKEAIWMMSAEAASASAYWTDFDTRDPIYNGYQHSVVSLNWGSKRDYATWFSADPAAKLAILALPMSPIAAYLGRQPQRVTQNLEQATVGGYEQNYGDYLLMYSALAGKPQAAAALAQAEKLPERFIDQGNSRAYLLAWIMTR
jgi:endo-1,3(4)-beta-glucanase